MRPYTSLALAFVFGLCLVVSLSYMDSPKRMTLPNENQNTAKVEAVSTAPPAPFTTISDVLITDEVRHSPNYRYCNESSLKMVFGMMGAPHLIIPRVVPALTTYLRHERTVVYLENEGDPHTQDMVAKHLTGPSASAAVKAVSFDVAFLKMSRFEEEVVRPLHPEHHRKGAWKALPLLFDLHERFPAFDVYFIVDDDTHMVTHNLRLWLSSVMVAEVDARARGCRMSDDLSRGTSFEQWWGSGGSLPKRTHNLPKLHDKVALGYRHAMSGALDAKGQPIADSRFHAMPFPHGGSGVALTRPTLAAMNESKVWCLENCLMLDGDVRLGCCATHVGAEIANDLRFSPFSFRTTLSKTKYHPWSEFVIGLHDFRNATVREAFTEVVDQIADVHQWCGADPMRHSSKRCRLLAARGSTAPIPYFFEDIVRAWKSARVK